MQEFYDKGKEKKIQAFRANFNSLDHEVLNLGLPYIK